MRQLVLNFFASFKRTKDPRVLVGQDYLGNRYFEQRDNGRKFFACLLKESFIVFEIVFLDFTAKRHRPLQRSFISADKNEWEKVPPEWDCECSVLLMPIFSRL